MAGLSAGLVAPETTAIRALKAAPVPRRFWIFAVIACALRPGGFEILARLLRRKELVQALTASPCPTCSLRATSEELGGLPTAYGLCEEAQIFGCSSAGSVCAPVPWQRLDGFRGVPERVLPTAQLYEKFGALAECLGALRVVVIPGFGDRLSQQTSGSLGPAERLCFGCAEQQRLKSGLLFHFSSVPGRLTGAEPHLDSARPHGHISA
mmetsp:Transcript_99480/g.276824  ORF Transcript_99480/g.276824 Transcript_99480/m.276824 type:complete len:209 (-) Transcript_99480:493-1119(-)